MEVLFTDSTNQERAELTTAGRAYAESVIETSMVARVALGGYASDWPASHVSAAIKAVNDKA
jgi:hypothetical protein